MSSRIGYLIMSCWMKYRESESLDGRARSYLLLKMTVDPEFRDFNIAEKVIQQYRVLKQYKMLKKHRPEDKHTLNTLSIKLDLPPVDVTIDELRKVRVSDYLGSYLKRLIKPYIERHLISRYHRYYTDVINGVKYYIVETIPSIMIRKYAIRYEFKTMEAYIEDFNVSIWFNALEYKCEYHSSSYLQSITDLGVRRISKSLTINDDGLKMRIIAYYYLLNYIRGRYPEIADRIMHTLQLDGIRGINNEIIRIYGSILLTEGDIERILARYVAELMKKAIEKGLIEEQLLKGIAYPIAEGVEDDYSRSN